MAVPPDTLLAEIRALEEALHRPEVRGSRAAVEALLAEDFFEFGSSGTVYRRPQIIDLLVAEASDVPAGALRADDYALTPISADAVLLTYRTTREADGAPGRAVLRSSIWRRSGDGWRLVFHQGTPSTA